MVFRVLADFETGNARRTSGKEAVGSVLDLELSICLSSWIHL
jgi:hypothetical protein